MRWELASSRHNAQSWYKILNRTHPVHKISHRAETADVADVPRLNLSDVGSKRRNRGSIGQPTEPYPEKNEKSHGEGV